MADMNSRGGQKQGQNNPQHPEQHRTVGEKPERPDKGQPGGPKENVGQSRPEHKKSQ